MTKPTALPSALIWAEVALSAISGLHPAVAAHRLRADVVDGAGLDFSRWSESALEVLQVACPPLLAPRRSRSTVRYEIVGGAQIVSALRRVLPAEASTPALLLPLWLRGDRLAGVSAMWELCVASVHARRDLGALQRLFTDACAQGHNPLRAAPSLAALRDAMQLQRLKS
jgi:hypothetical protein